jgi:50S ribosomal protein L16 3-hydroxylase
MMGSFRLVPTILLTLSKICCLRRIFAFEFLVDNHRSMHRHTLHQSASSTSDPSFSLDTLNGPWNITAFAATQCWGRRPLLLQSAFDTQELPSWDDLLELGIAAENEDEPIASRIIRHIPGRLDSYEVEFGPFDQTTLLNEMKENKILDDSSTVSTLVLNDVDRAIPAVSDWMDALFDFLPRWRRDDAQVSLAPRRGGIGPHVDNYDVFLVQQSGTREWTVGLQEITTEKEYDTLVEASEVRVLDLEGSFPTTTVRLQAGDCLYIPPRVLHHGTSASNDCITLSVGCRAPSASDLLSKVAETIQTSASKAANERYTDSHLFEIESKEISKRTKRDMKNLVMAALEEVLEDDSQWDDLVGRLVTAPNRPTMNYPVPLSSIDKEWKSELGIWGESESTLNAVMEGKGCLFRAEGISFACSSISTTKGDTIHRLFAQGNTFELNGTTSKDDDSNALFNNLVNRIANGRPLDKDFLVEMNNVGRAFLLELIELGFLYGEENA